MVTLIELENRVDEDIELVELKQLIFSPSLISTFNNILLYSFLYLKVISISKPREFSGSSPIVAAGLSGAN